MGWFGLLVLAVALAMDAFAVAVVTGVSVQPLTRRHVFRLAFHFGFFQAAMLMLGWAAGQAVRNYIGALDHWIAFGLLAFVGARMIHSALTSHEGRHSSTDPTSGWELVLLSTATSVDALAVGISLSLVGSAIVVPALIVGAVATGFTGMGMALGRQIRSIWGIRVEFAGGLVLILIGVNIILRHSIG